MLAVSRVRIEVPVGQPASSWLRLNYRCWWFLICRSVCRQKRQMEMEREREQQPILRERQRQSELQLLRKKNQELALQTRKLEEKVKCLEKVGDRSAVCSWNSAAIELRLRLESLGLGIERNKAGRTERRTLQTDRQTGRQADEKIKAKRRMEEQS